MLFFPKKTKYRKMHKGRVGGYSSRCNKIDFGSYGLRALGPCRLTAKQIESTRVAIMRKLKRNGKVWIRVFPDIPVTAKPLEVRMGKGKGNVEYWMCRVRTNRILFEVDGVPEKLAKEALLYASSKLPIPTEFVVKGG